MFVHYAQNCRVVKQEKKEGEQKQFARAISEKYKI